MRAVAERLVLRQPALAEPLLLAVDDVGLGLHEGAFDDSCHATTPLRYPLDARATPGVPAGGLADDEHRDPGVRKDALRLAAEKQAAETGAAVRSHDDRIALARTRCLENALPRLRIHREQRGAVHARPPGFEGDRGERLFRRLLGEAFVLPG